LAGTRRDNTDKVARSVIYPDSRHRIPHVAFELDDYKLRTDRLRWADLDLADFGAKPLETEALRCIRYMHDVEYHTICYLRDLLLTPAHQDPTITSFLSFWVYEEYWHGEALGAVLSAHGEPHGEARVAAVRSSLGWRDSMRPLLMTIGGWLATSDFTAVHMTWGAINEWTTQAGYVQLARRASHPILSELLGRIARQEGRHIDFYSTQARARLADSPRARRLARLALRRFWHPVGAGVMPPEETRFLTRYLMGDEQGREVARRIDRRIDRLPGLKGLSLMDKAVTANLAIDPARRASDAEGRSSSWPVR
jgi:hypothetical protein